MKKLIFILYFLLALSTLALAIGSNPLSNGPLFDGPINSLSGSPIGKQTTESEPPEYHSTWQGIQVTYQGGDATWQGN
jgi:hypothetical protein